MGEPNKKSMVGRLSIIIVAAIGPAVEITDHSRLFQIRSLSKTPPIRLSEHGLEKMVPAEDRIQSIACRDDEWTLDYEMPPLKIMQIRLAGLSGIDPAHGRHAALEIEMDGTCWELDESGEPPALGFARLLKREDPDVILSEWGDSTILPLLRQQAQRLRFSLPLNRDESASIHQSRGRSYTSYGRILFKASATTLFGRIHVDKQNSFISEKCDFAGLWELARVTKLPRGHHSSFANRRKDL